jgi:hypothetical protein
MTTETRHETQRDAVQRIIVNGGGEPFGARDVVAQLRSEGLLLDVTDDAAYQRASAQLSALRASRAQTGIIRLGQGMYAYRPDELDLDVEAKAAPGGTIARGPKPQSMRTRTRELMRSNPGIEYDSDTIAFELDVDKRQAAQTLASLEHDEPAVERVRLGVYRYVSGRDKLSKRAASNGHAEPAYSRSAELDDVARAVDDAAFAESGLRVLARTSTGERVCIDDNDTTWLVRVTVDARLL